MSKLFKSPYYDSMNETTSMYQLEMDKMKSDMGDKLVI